MRAAKKIGLGSIAVLLIAVLFFFYMQRATESSAPTPPASEEHAAAVKTQEKEALPTPVESVTEEPATPAPVQEKEQVEAAPGPPAMEEIAISGEEAVAKAIDPVRLAQAELALTKNELYEDVALEILPTLSIQTHNPMWVLEDEAAAAAGITTKKTRNGPFGTNIQPNKNEIWLRIPPEHALEHRDIMAENADLYRAETGTNETITVMLWVGGRPYARQHYE